MEAGAAISHYRIISRLGVGGMGEVYLAEDTRLARTVALKILPPELAADSEHMRRFMQEAKAASALSHPSVAHIYEIGEAEQTSFIAMEYIEGRTLDAIIRERRLAPAEVVNIAIQVADALDEAHSKGVIHRDIKPANIMVTHRGQVKVLDFGIAKLAQQEEPGLLSDLPQPPPYTPPLQISSPYTSPEQALGQKGDRRSDLYSLGLIIYEMAAGKKPLPSQTLSGAGARVFSIDPQAMSRLNYNVPPGLWRVIGRCLDEDAARRYQFAGELLSALRRLGDELESGGGAAMPVPSAHQPGPALSPRIVITLLLVAAAFGGFYFFGKGVDSGDRPIESIAVLPFVNASNDTEIDYLSDGLTESIINSLSRVSRLRVVPWSIAFRYKNQSVDPQEFGRSLGVDAVLIGRVIQVAGKLVVRTDLISVADSAEMWGEQYNRNPSDILAIQEEIARRISDRLRTKLTGEEGRLLVKRYTDNAQAYELYLRGRFFWNKRNREGYNRAIEYFQKAIDLDPNYALAYAGLADCYVLGGNTPQEPRLFMPRAAAARKALEIDEELAEAHTSLAKVKLSYEWDFSGAEAGFKRAIELSPDYATAYQWYGICLTAMGRHEESIARRRRAQELDPTSLSINSGLGRAYYWARQYDQAIAQIKETRELEPTYGDTLWSMGLSYEQKGMYTEAIREFREAASLAKENPVMKAALGHAYALAGKRAEAQKILADLRGLSKRRYVSAYPLALICAALGENDRAFAHLEEAFLARDEMMTHLKVDPRLDSLRGDARFKSLLNRVGLP